MITTKSATATSATVVIGERDVLEAPLPVVGVGVKVGAEGLGVGVNGTFAGMVTV